MYQITVVYLQKPGKTLRAINFFNRHPTLMGKPMMANSVFLVDKATLDANRIELDRYQRNGIIEIRDRHGNPFQFPSDDICVPGLHTEDELVARELAKASSVVASQIGSTEVKEPDLDMPPPLEDEKPASVDNDAFFAEVKIQAEKIRPSKKRKKRSEAASEG